MGIVGVFFGEEVGFFEGIAVGCLELGHIDGVVVLLGGKAQFSNFDLFDLFLFLFIGRYSFKFHKFVDFLFDGVDCFWGFCLYQCSFKEKKYFIVALIGVLEITLCDIILCFLGELFGLL